MNVASWPPRWALAATVLFAAGAPACKGAAVERKPTPSASPSASATSGAPAARTVRLVRRPSQIGERLRATRESSLTLSVEFWQESEKLGSNDSVRKEKYDRTMQVLGLVGGVPAKASVHYDHYELHETTPSKPPNDDTSLDGKSYLADATDGKVVVTTDKGKPVSREEASLLGKLHADLGKDDPIVAAIGDKPMTVGEPLSMREELLRALLTTQSGELKAGKIWLEQIRTDGGQEVAVFKWAADTHSQEENGLEITWHMTGSAIIALSPAVTLSTSLSGSLDVSGETMQRGARVNLQGAGAIHDDSTLAVTPP